MGKSGGGGNQQQKKGMTLSATASAQNDGGSLGETVQGVISDSVGFAVGTTVSLLMAEVLRRVVKRFFGNKAALSESSDTGDPRFAETIRLAIRDAKNAGKVNFKTVYDGVIAHNPEMDGDPDLKAAIGKAINGA